jgi:hypothetical protein
MENRQISEVLRKAAESIASNKTEFCCHAIKSLLGWGQDFEVMSFFQEIFEPVGMGRPCWYPWWDDGDSESRILALLLAAEIAEDR